MVKLGDVSFSWGKKKGRGGAKREVQFYESFTYDGIEYFLYDSVYLYKDGEPEPYIGKLIKIWEPGNKTKRVKVLWFFHPSEISNYVGHEKVLENELFLATGEGVGLANINPLEAIAGKCNVLCLSKDKRNRQPSAEELKMADYVFYRTFDVGSLTVSDKLEEKIASIEVGFLLNKKVVQLPIQSHEINVDDKDVAETVQMACVSNEGVAREGNYIEPVANTGSLSPRGGETTNNSMEKAKGLPQTHDITEPDGRGPVSLPSKELPSASGQKTKLKSSDSQLADSDEVVKSAPNVMSDNRAGHKSELCDTASLGNEKQTKCAVGLKVESVENVKNPVLSSVPTDKLNAVLGKQFNLSSNSNSSYGTHQHWRKHEMRPTEAIDCIKQSRILKKMSSLGKEIDETSLAVKRLISANSKDALEESLSQKRKLDCTPKHQSDNVKKPKLDSCATPTNGASDGTPQSVAVSSYSNKEPRTVLVFALTASGKGKLTKQFDNIINGNCEPSKSECGKKSNDNLYKVFHKPAKGLEVKELVGRNNALPKRLKSDDKMDVKSAGELSNGLVKQLKSDGLIKDKSIAKLHKASLKQFKNVEIEAYGSVKEVTRRSLTDKEKYYTSIESRIRIAQEQGTLVLLQNLDPGYTSSEVEDIVLCAFGEICSAKMLQSTATSSPHSGQAFVIFKTREAADMVVRMLEQECLMLPNLRPLVGIPGALSTPEKQSSYPGHFVIDKLKQQIQRDSREAVSNSHSSQWNTLEYEMALEWRLLQDRSNLSSRKLFKQQEEELRKLKKSFQSKNV